MEYLVMDEQLYNEARALAGIDVHDVYSATGIYKSSVEFYNKKIARGADASMSLFLATKYERILRSFLFTKDINKSKQIIEDSLKSLET